MGALPEIRGMWRDEDGALRCDGDPVALVADGSVLGHALRRLAAEQADPDGADPIASHDSYV